MNATPMIIIWDALDTRHVPDVSVQIIIPYNILAVKYLEYCDISVWNSTKMLTEFMTCDDVGPL